MSCQEGKRKNIPLKSHLFGSLLGKLYNSSRIIQLSSSSAKQTESFNSNTNQFSCFQIKTTHFFPLMWQEIIVPIYWGSCAVGLRAAKMCQPELLNSSMIYWINERMRNIVKGNLGPREHLSANATGLENPGLQLETVFHKAVPPTVIHVRQIHKTGFRLPTGSAWPGQSNLQPEELFQTPTPREAAPLGTAQWCCRQEAANSFVQNPGNNLGLL